MIPLFISRVVCRAHGQMNRASRRALNSLLSTEQLSRVIRRERARSDRTGEIFSMAVFAVQKNKAGMDLLAHLARILTCRLRLTDDAGFLDRHRIGVVLPATSASGARTVIDDVCVCIPAGLPLPDCTVFTYPAEWTPEEEDGDQTPKDQSNDGEKVRSMGAMFIRPLPIWKRLLDITASSIGLFVLSPLFLVVSAAVKLTSPGPVFFLQKRSGIGGKEFWMVKFRSMVADAEQRKSELLALNEQDGPAFKMKNDPRTTPLGRFLRRTSIDELPQLWNVLRGDMSLVGPRPLPCDETESCLGWQRERLDVTPGLTCIWQVEGRSTVSFSDWARMDVEYIRSRSLLGDVKLLLQTIPAVLSRKGAS